MEAEKKHPVLNEEQRKAAFVEKNAVVAAGAGSGKTFVLASRYAWLVTEKNISVREILCLTFTKKAAAQMYRRIYRQLAEIARDETQTTPDQRARARQAIGEFVQARIQTLDSYCTAIVKQAANRYGINPDFAIDEGRCEQLARNEALPFLIANRDHPALKKLYHKKNPTGIVDDIFVPFLFRLTSIDRPLDPVKDMNNQISVITREWEKHSNFIEKKILELIEIYFENEYLLPDLSVFLNQYRSGEIAIPAKSELNEYFSRLLTLPHSSAAEWAETQSLSLKMIDFLTFFSSLAYFSQKKGKRKDNPVKDILNELRCVFAEFSSLAVYCMQAGLVYSMLTLISELQKHYIDQKREKGILTHNDIARLARSILLEQKDIRQNEKESLQAIMIDEFQDNNELQKDLLFLLAEKTEITAHSVPEAKHLSPGKLFFVGDEKQSVYRFRDADVSVFRKLKHDLDTGDFSLKTNYRSAPSLIGAFNTIFGGMNFDPEKNASAPGAPSPAVFAPESPDSFFPLFEAAYSPLRAGKKGEGKLTLCILDKSSSEEDLNDDEIDRLTPIENEARFTAERIKKLLNEKDDFGKTKYRPNDIAILFRSRSPQRFFEKHLMLLNIPYTNEDLSGFFYGGPVNDLMSVLRLAAYSADRAAYAQMLRSPFAGVSLPGLAACLTAMDDTPGSGPFGNEPLSLLDDIDREKYLFGQKIYQNISGKAATESITSLISELWYNEGYRYETMWNPQTAAFNELHDYLFHLAALADEENQGLAAFTDSVHNLYKSDERLKDLSIPLERPGAVQLMTVHKSKGLEFPVVFLCCCDKKSANNSSGDIFSTDESGVTIDPPLPLGCKNIKKIKHNYFWERLLEIENKKSTAELRRLLYVGMTRAENELYLSGCLGISKALDISCNEDFSLNLKKYIDMQTEKKSWQSGIKGDSIIGGYTFFDLCLPAFGAHIPECPNPQPAFFTIEEIPVYDEKYVRNTEDQSCRFSNDQRGLAGFLKTVGPFYDMIGKIETPAIFKRHFTPTSLVSAATNKAKENIKVTTTEYFGENSGDVFQKVDTILERYAKKQEESDERFNSGSFGTIAHICAEALLTGSEAQIPAKLAGYISPSDADVLLDAGKEIALRFSRSPLGIVAGKSKERKSEFSFRSMIHDPKGNEIFINGTIDLVFEDTQSVYVVDFKTDNMEIPSEHIPQMACYYRAACDLFATPQKKNCKTLIYYLRSGRAVDVTEQAKAFNIFSERVN